MVTLELLNRLNERKLLQLERGDIPERFVESVEYTINMSHYGEEHGLSGFCIAIKKDNVYVGIVLVGEAILGDVESVEIRNKHPFRIIGFMIDKKYRGKGIGTHAFQMVLNKFYMEYGDKPILLECHRENFKAQRFYEQFGFINTKILVGTDYIMLKNHKKNIDN